MNTPNRSDTSFNLILTESCPILVLGMSMLTYLKHLDALQPGRLGILNTFHLDAPIANTLGAPVRHKQGMHWANEFKRIVWFVRFSLLHFFDFSMFGPIGLFVYGSEYTRLFKKYECAWKKVVVLLRDMNFPNS